MLVFVYGTLKLGYSNSHVLDISNGELLGDFITEPKYTMLDLGAFPGVLLEGEDSIHGEVYEVDTLKYIDHLDSYPDFYSRVEIDTTFGKAWMYVLHSEEWKSHISSGGRIKDGIW